MAKSKVSTTRITEWVKHWAADEIAVALADHPALVPHRDARGRNWLHLAAGVNLAKHRDLDSASSIAVASVLIELGLDINAPAFSEGAWQATPLWYAVGRGNNLPLAAFLLEHGSTPEHCLWAASFNEDVDMLRLLVQHGAPLEAIAERETALLGAVKWSKFRGAEVLLEAGADPNYQDDKQMTALHYMLKKNADAKHFPMFVTHRARGDIPGPDGRTAQEILMRKRDPAFHTIAAGLATG